MVFGHHRSKVTPDRPAAAVTGSGTVVNVEAPLAPDKAIELLPIPGAVIAVVKGQISVVSKNSAFDSLNFNREADRSPIGSLLGSRICAFLESEQNRDSFEWQFGESVDCRHYRVHLARASGPGTYRCLLTLIDQTSILRTEMNLRREMMTDSLTGLPNRAGFSELLEGVIGEQADAQARFAVMIVNLDRFSRVNACMGSMAGDELLMTVARRLKGALRGRDVLARTGGDEFGILMSLDEGRSDADHVAKRIQGALSTPFRLSAFEIRVSCSIGIAFGSDLVDDAEDLIRHAQFAVKRSKASGCVEAYQTQAFDIVREQFGMETALRRAIDSNQLRLTYQPICDLSTGRVVSFEALARWLDDEGVEISPTDFIPVAEESGLIVPLGRWAMTQAAETLASWDGRAGGNCGTRFAVNLSAIQLQRDNVPRMVEGALAASGLGGERFTLELTESALIADPDRVAQIMHALKALGTTLAMDDFGTGYSNLAHLQKLPIDVLKMDRSFVTGMLADRDKISIVRAILSLAQALGMKTTAEGIESNALAQTLAALGCTYGQGFHYSRPLEAEAAYQFLMERNA
ncbi:MAG: GGDEF-domain containing protein [Sphingomonas sp. 32-62-10]|nr:MAG: GGDEF-domain containing protein [Sphingomonas sp. 12-62-6]OYX39938.1 MAG: GGDEF-domain containing protein [Sphingomonas sp. 32-62-10]